MDQDVIDKIGAVRREVRTCERDGRPARAVVAERTYDTTVDDMWDAITNPERIPRWFLPVSGELKLGGRYQLEGNAGGEVTTCEPPTHLAVTWEFGEAVTWLDVRLSEAPEGGTRLRLEHVAPVDDLGHWDQFGPGAVGIGWDLGLLGLAEYIRTGEAVTGDPTGATIGAGASTWPAAARPGARPTSPPAPPRPRPAPPSAATIAAYLGEPDGGSPEGESPEGEAPAGGGEPAG